VTRPLPVDPTAIAGSDIELDVRTEDSPPSREELIEGTRRADGLLAFLSDPVDAALLDECSHLRIVANFAVGYDNIDVAAASERGVWVSNTPDVLTEATADLTWTLLLALARRVREGERLVREGKFHGWSPTMLLGTELYGYTMGIFGLGRIGRAVARRARAFGMEVVYVSRHGAPAELEAELAAKRVSKEGLLEQADVLSIHAPLGEQTRHAFATSEFRHMKSSALLLNTSRGPLVDEAALVTALERGEIAGAGLDVYEREPEVHPGLVDRDDVVLLPHLGSATRHTRRRMAEIALDNAVAVLRGQSPTTPVNSPAGR
jgi:glyoxylate reductase